jgi:hypothetical protein
MLQDFQAGWMIADGFEAIRNTETSNAQAKCKSAFRQNNGKRFPKQFGMETGIIRKNGSRFFFLLLSSHVAFNKSS